MADKILLIGAGGHAKCMIDILARQCEYQLVGIIGREDESISELMGFQVFKGDAHLEFFWRQGIHKILIGVGGYRNNNTRKDIFFRLKSMHFEIVNLIDATATIAEDVIMGDGVVIFPGVIINPGVKIGNNVIVNNGSIICHDTVVQDHVNISPGVTIGASSSIGEGAFFALGSSAISGVQIGSEILVAAGAMVTCDISEPGVYFGIPAKLKQT